MKEDDTISTRDAQKQIILHWWQDFKRMVGIRPYAGLNRWITLLVIVTVIFAVVIGVALMSF